ncbi:MAG TPA: hypothetical protein EYN66_00060, partial [Myxococcales bacterium]|nr:hypothetical protein [Myxococcales bacterium]
MQSTIPRILGAGLLLLAIAACSKDEKKLLVAPQEATQSKVVATTPEPEKPVEVPQVVVQTKLRLIFRAPSLDGSATLKVAATEPISGLPAKGLG